MINVAFGAKILRFDEHRVPEIQLTFAWLLSPAQGHLHIRLGGRGLASRQRGHEVQRGAEEARWWRMTSPGFRSRILPICLKKTPLILADIPN